MVKDNDLELPYHNTILTIERELKALNTISQNFKLVGNCLHAKNKYAESGWVFVKELEDEEEHNAWKEAINIYYSAKMEHGIFSNEESFKRIQKIEDFSCRVTREMRSPTFNLFVLVNQDLNMKHMIIKS